MSLKQNENTTKSIVHSYHSRLGCISESDTDKPNSRQKLVIDLLQDKEKPICPKVHTDSIVPIMYGYPNEEMFAQSDSGLVVLGGCELGEDRYFCKIHKIGF